MFVGIENRFRGDSTQEAWSKLRKQGCEIAADDAKATKEGGSGLVYVRSFPDGDTCRKVESTDETKEGSPKLGLSAKNEYKAPRSAAG